ncbi:MAG TPA: Spy/CpxP family protein refolding chaperone [Gemmatimonadaceae bacterium]
MRRVMITIAALLMAAPLPAQQNDRAAAAKAADSAAIASPERRQLERRLHQRMLDVVRNRLDLTPDQVDKLSAANEHYEQQRRTLAQRERSLRLELRAQLRRGDSADQNRVAQLLDQTLQAQQERLDLYRKEQSDLAAFMTPVQRAKYMGLQEQMRSRVEELRRGRNARNRGPRSGGSPGAQPRPDSTQHRH